MDTGSPSETVTNEPVRRRLVGTMPKTGHSTEGGYQDSDELVSPHSGEGVQTKIPHRSPKPGGARFPSVGDLGIKDSEHKDSECYEWKREKDRTRTDDPAEQSTEAAASDPLPSPDGNMDEAIVPIKEENPALLYTCPSAEMTRESVSEPERLMGGDSGPDPPPTKSPTPIQHKRAGKDPIADLAPDPAGPSFSMGNELQFPTLHVGGGRVSVSTAGYVGDELWM